LKPSSAAAFFNRASAFQNAELWNKASEDYTKSATLAEASAIPTGVDVAHCKKQVLYCRGHYYMFEKKNMEILNGLSEGIDRTVTKFYAALEEKMTKNLQRHEQLRKEIREVIESNQKKRQKLETLKAQTASLHRTVNGTN